MGARFVQFTVHFHPCASFRINCTQISMSLIKLRHAATNLCAVTTTQYDLQTRRPKELIQPLIIMEAVFGRLHTIEVDWPLRRPPQLRRSNYGRGYVGVSMRIMSCRSENSIDAL